MLELATNSFSEIIFQKYVACRVFGGKIMQTTNYSTVAFNCIFWKSFTRARKYRQVLI